MESSTSLAATISRNTFFGIMASLTQMGTRLVTVPVVIGHLGLDGYGIWSIIMVAAGYMRFGSAGIKSAFLKYVAEATGNKDFAKASQLLSTGSLAMLAFSIIGLIPFILFSDGLVHAVGVPEHLSASAAEAITVLAVIMILANVGGVYESIVMGGHRIDLIRMLNTATSIMEAVALVGVLYLGYGLFAMAVVMASSEVIRLVFCFYAAKKIVPEIRIGTINIASRTLPDLVRFAGSYQLVAILEVLYAGILPLAILKLFGANIAGLYAVAYRLISAAALPAEALVLPLLSSLSMVHATSSGEQLQLLLAKSFKATCALVMLPLAFAATFGPLIILAWTGLTDTAFHLVLWILCLAAMFKGFSLLGLVLYRASGRAVMDNVRQVIRIVVLGAVCYFGSQVGFVGVISSLAVTECVGFVFMLMVLSHVYEALSIRRLFSDAAKIVAATCIIILVSVLITNIPVPWTGDERSLAILKLGMTALATLVAIWPAVLLTGSLSKSELYAVFPRSGLSCK
jgi:O-antigen/teichoic acid export membrane protein